MFSSTFVVLALSASAFANIFTTSPVASTTFTGGQATNITWQDDGTSPNLSALGPCSISIYAGNSQQQTSLQTISPSTDVSQSSSISFTPDATIGPNANEYFIRFQSLGLMDATSPQYPALAFSAKFTMAGMTGTFSAAVQSQIDGQSTAPIGGSTSAAASGSAGASGGAASATTTGAGAAKSSAAASGSKSSSTVAGAKASASSAAGKSVVVGGAGFVAVAAAMAALF